MMETGHTTGRRGCCGKNKKTIGGLIALGITFAVAAVFLPQVYKTMVKKVSLSFDSLKQIHPKQNPKQNHKQKRCQNRCTQSNKTKKTTSPSNPLK